MNTIILYFRDRGIYLPGTAQFFKAHVVTSGLKGNLLLVVDSCCQLYLNIATLLNLDYVFLKQLFFNWLIRLVPYILLLMYKYYKIYSVTLKHRKSFAKIRSVSDDSSFLVSDDVSRFEGITGDSPILGTDVSSCF